MQTHQRPGGELWKAITSVESRSVPSVACHVVTMRPIRPLPQELETRFSVANAKRLGISPERLRRGDLERPFHRVRSLESEPLVDDDEEIDPYELQRRSRVMRAREYLPRMHENHFYCKDTAVSAWGGPLPLVLTESGDPAIGEELPLHVSAFGRAALPRAQGVTRHRAQAHMTSVREVDGLRVTSPATTWASMGHLALPDLIALGDYFCRVWRPGFGRPHPGKPPLATIDQLRAALAAGRRRGGANLRTALGLIREDSWSPREAHVRFELVSHGLPEPELNVDVYDASGRFIGCVDMLYRQERVIVEYHGEVHRSTWATDVERIAALRAAGWTVIEVTAPLLRNPDRLVRRVAQALGR